MDTGAVDRLTAITEAERALRTVASRHLWPLLKYFGFLEETVLIALENSGRPLQVHSDKNNPLVLAIVTTTRFLSIAKAAMDLALTGHPLEAIALTRVLAELAQCTQYLVRHPESIDQFLSGSFKLDALLKKAKAESPSGQPDPFGHFRGIASEYAHASPNLLAIALKIEGPSLKAPVVVDDLDRAQDAAHGIALVLLIQYVTFRLTLRAELHPLTELAQRDSLLLRPDNVRILLSEEAVDDAQLELMKLALTSIRREGPA